MSRLGETRWPCREKAQRVFRSSIRPRSPALHHPQFYA